MRIKIISVMLVASIILAGCSSGRGYARKGFDFSELNRIAVVDVVGMVGNEAVKNQIADFFTMELLKKGYSPVERSQVQVILKEQKFQASDLTSSEDLARAGKILNVPAVLIVNIPKMKDEINMTAKLIDVEDGSVLWLASGSGRTGKLLTAILGAGAGAAAGAIISDGSSEGAIIGGAVGGLAGYSLSPQEAERASEVIEDMCESLPYSVPD
jgi:TolB-like protein